MGFQLQNRCHEARPAEISLKLAQPSAIKLPMLLRLPGKLMQGPCAQQQCSDDCLREARLEGWKIYLVALPWQAASQKEEEGVGEGLEIVPSACRPAQVGMHARIPHRPSEHIRPLVVLHMRLADRVPPSCGCSK